MSLIDKVLEVPGYKWTTSDGSLSAPSKGQILREFLSRTNIFRSKKSWIAFIGWFWVLCLIPVMVIFIGWYITWPLAGICLLYGMMGMSTHGTIWYHRYATHKAFKFRNKFWRFFTQNLVIKLIPEETYVVSHHVHHAKSDKPGDPYNASAGFLYCFLADVNHQPIAKDLSEAEYAKTVQFVSHTGIYINSYAQYLKWGSVGNPFATLAHWILNWAFWFAVFFLIGGTGLALGMFTGALLWVLAVRTFNYNGHGGGTDKRKDGVDYNWKDMSINQTRPGLLSGEWHNNHHLFPNSARSGFLPYQLDTAWMYIYALSKIGGITSYKDSKAEFLREYVIPNKKAVNTRVKT